MNLSILDAVFFFGGGMGVTVIWLFRRDWLENKEPSKVLFITCITLAVIGLIGCVLLISGNPTKLHFLIFPLLVALYHHWLFGTFKKKTGRSPVDTAFTSSGALVDRAYNIVFALPSMLVPVIAGSYMEIFAV